MKTDLFLRLRALLFPHRCFICDKALPYPETVCPKCEKLILRFDSFYGPVCDVCGLRRAMCNCGPRRLYDKAVFPLLYEGDVRKSLHKFKFSGRLDKLEPFADAMLAALHARGVPEETDLLTYIPMAPRQEKRRGYNQARLLCEALQKRTGLPMLPLLTKQEQTSQQHKAPGFLFRSGNVLGVYEPDPALLHEIEDRRILVVDDILTSGATLNEAAKTLLIFGADRVYAAAVAGVPKKRKPNKKKTARAKEQNEP